MSQCASGASRFFSANRAELGLALSILVVLGLTSVLDERHIYWQNPWPSFVDIVRQSSMLGIFALGSAVVIIAGGIDLSCGSVIAFSGTICATLLVLLAPEEMRTAAVLRPPVIAAAIAGTVLVGLAIGSLHAWLITVVRLPPFVATLATLVGLRSLGRSIVENTSALHLGGKSTQIQIYDAGFRYLATSVWIPATLFLVLAATAWLLLSRTVTGRHLYALGGNEEAARLSGIRTDSLKWLAYCVGASCSTLAGILYIADQSVADPQNLGRGYELNAIAAAVVGGCSLQGGVGTVQGTVLGVVFLRTVIDGVAKIIKTGADVYEGLIVGILVVVAVAFNQLRQRGEPGRSLFPGVLGTVAGATLAAVAGVLAAILAGGVAGAAASVAALAAVVAAKIIARTPARTRGEPR